jgi:hypothetical protein
MIKYRISKTELIALTLTGLFLGIGIYLGISNEAVWLSRFGSLMIITGVLLAAIRFTETLSSRVDSFINEKGPLIVKAITDNYEQNYGGKLAPSEKLKLINDAETRIKADVLAYQSSRIRVFKNYEIGIVSFGTLVNGFGEWFISYMF